MGLQGPQPDRLIRIANFRFPIADLKKNSRSTAGAKRAKQIAPVLKIGIRQLAMGNQT